MNNNLTHLPKLLKRKHIINDIGLSESLYYKLVKENLEAKEKKLVTPPQTE